MRALLLFLMLSTPALARESHPSHHGSTNLQPQYITWQQYILVIQNAIDNHAIEPDQPAAFYVHCPLGQNAVEWVTALTGPDDAYFDEINACP